MATYQDGLTDAHAGDTVKLVVNRGFTDIQLNQAYKVLDHGKHTITLKEGEYSAQFFRLASR